MPLPRNPADGIAVFGSSEPTAGEPAYANALELGARLARGGYTVVTGGYGGVMEAASRGAREAGGSTIGVTTAIFDRSPNRWLSETVQTGDLYERTRQLIEHARGFVILPGKAGTLAEIAWLWALDRAGCLNPGPVVLLGDSWRLIYELLERESMLDPEQLERTHLARTPIDAVRLIADALRTEGR